MFRKRIVPSLAALLCLAGAAGSAVAAEVDCDSVYCFRSEDFSQEQSLAGICITSLPESSTGTLLLGTRVLRPGDILTAEQVGAMTFAPLRSEVDAAAQVEYLPIYDGHVAPCTTMNIAIRGKEDKAPIAEDFALETYKNLELQGKLKVSDPEGLAMTYTVTRQPKRGSVTLAPDGSFTYTPKKNKVGIDSFVYTATDPAGKVSREATVTITILKPMDSRQYSDTQGTTCRFTAEWLKNSGIFEGEMLAGNACFSPDKTVTRGEFTTMLVKALELPTQDNLDLMGYQDSIPNWLQPYLAAAIRSGLTTGLPTQETFGANTAISGAEAAVMLCSALDIHPEMLEEVSLQTEDGAPLWASAACSALLEHDMVLSIAPLTREEAANILYQTVQMKNARENLFTQ